MANDSSSRPGATHLRALVKLIQKNVEEIIQEHEKVGDDVPTLDQVSPVKFDSSENVTEALTDSIKIVEGACAQLSFTVASPSHTIANVSRLGTQSFFPLILS